MVSRQPPKLLGGTHWYEWLEAIVGTGDTDWRCCVPKRTACRAGSDLFVGWHSRRGRDAPHPGHSAKEVFEIDLDTDIVTPAGRRMAIRRGKDGSGVAQFGPVCGDCPLLEQCTTAAGGHSIRVGRHERRIAEARRAARRAGVDR